MLQDSADTSSPDVAGLIAKAMSSAIAEAITSEVGTALETSKAKPGLHGGDSSDSDSDIEDRVGFYNPETGVPIDGKSIGILKTVDEILLENAKRKVAESDKEKSAVDASDDGDMSEKKNKRPPSQRRMPRTSREREGR